VFDWSGLSYSTIPELNPHPVLVGKVTLDIICKTAFGYEADSLHDPPNKLAVAYRVLSGTQSGICRYHLLQSSIHIHISLGYNLTKFRILVLIPGVPRFLASNLAYLIRPLFEYSSVTRKPALLPPHK
jgi:hypothetical protein